MDIPILNKYYLLCYAWDKLEEGRKVQVSESDYKESVDLYARVLINGCAHLLLRGLSRDYTPLSQEYSGIKGKINFSESLNRNLFRQAKAICEFDDFNVNILANQILKACIFRLTKIRSLNNESRKALLDLYFRFASVDDVALVKPHFSQVRIHRNNSFYEFILKICYLIYESTVLNESDGSYTFIEFFGTDKAMARLFESFVRNFYKKEQHRFKVRRENIKWQALPMNENDTSYLPKMETDITLESPEKKIIIDTKFYSKTTTEYYQAEKFHSSNLYQLYSYLRNVEETDSHPQNKSAQGILLYPTVTKNYNEAYTIGGHELKIVTIDLNKNWNEIEKNLLNLIQ